MAWLESITLTLGASIAKNILKSWLGDNISTTLLGDMVDFLKDEGGNAVKKAENERKIDQIGRSIVERIFPLFESEGIRIAKNQRDAIALELARTISRAQVTSKLLVDCNLDATVLANKLENANPQATRLFSADETAIYNLLLVETSKSIIEVATDLASFQYQFSKDILQSQDQILESLEQLLMFPNERSRQYEHDYLEAVHQSLDRLELFGVPQYDVVAHKQSLTIAYIALEVNIPSAENVKGEDQQASLAKVELTVDSNLLGSPDNELVHNAPINQLLAQARRIIIRGYAGSGKTTLQRWIAVQSASRNFPSLLAGWNNTVPFFIPLREYVDSGFPELENFPHYAARMVGGKPDDWVHQQLKSSRAIILIDGVDELPISKRPEMLQRLNQLVTNYPLARYIVTSRPHAINADLWPEWQEWIKVQGFVETVLQPMNNTCIDEFIDHWHSTLDRIISDEQEREDLSSNPDNLKRLLHRRPALRRLATNPLLCAMICALYRERRQSLPSERLKLYEECVEMLISHREERRMVGLRSDYPELNYSQQIALIQGFAYWMMHNGYSDVDTSEADHHFDLHLPNLSLSSVTGTQVRRLFVERSSLLNEPIIGRINFAHRTFQEYLAARAAVEAGDFGYLQKIALDDQWQEVIILAAGEARPKERVRLLQGLISKAEKHKRPRNQRQLYLLTLACLETCVDLEPEARRRVLERAACLFPPKDDDEVKRVASAGDPAIELLRPKPRLQRNEARRCVEALGLIGSDTALDAIAEYAHDERFISLDYIRILDNFDRQLFTKKVLASIPNLKFNKLDSWDEFEQLTNMRELEVSDLLKTQISPLISFPNLSILTLFGRYPSDLSFLASMPSLIKLGLYNLGDMQITDLKILAPLTNLTRLMLLNAKIEDISPLGSLPNLTNLAISGEYPSDLSSLASIPNLTLLGLNVLKTCDLSSLASIPKLTHLGIFGAKTNDMSALVSLPNLVSLAIDSEEIINLPPLTSLSNLTNVSIYGNENTVLDLSPLTSLPNLTHLSILQAKFVDLLPLAYLPNLIELSLDYEKITDLLPLASLSNLTQLSLNCTQIIDLSSLTSLPNLTQLSLSGAQNTDLSMLTSLPNLTQLSLSGTQISDLSPLTSLPNLNHLSLNGTNINSLSSLAEYTSSIQTLGLSSVQLYDLLPDLALLPKLIGLDLTGDKLTCFTPLMKFPHLKKLNMKENWIRDVNQLAFFTELIELNLSETYINDLAPLSSLIDLVELDISWTAVTDIHPLIGLPNLQRLNLRGTPVKNIRELLDKPGLEIIQ